MNEVLQLAPLAVGAFVIAAAAVEFARRPVALIYVLLGVHAWSLIGVVPSAQVLGVGVSPIDVVNVVAFLAALLRMRRGPRTWQWPLLGAVALIGYGVIRGIILLGDAALLGFRAELYFVVPAMFVSTLPKACLPAVLQAVVRFGLALSLFATVRWLLIAAGIELGPVAGDGIYTVTRVISAHAALWVAVALVFGVAALLHRAPQTRAHVLLAWSGLAFVVVLLSQHRSVWVATTIMLAVAFATARRHWYAKAAVVVAALLAVLVIEVGNLGEAGVVAESLSIAASDTSTWEWRIDRWANVWSTHAARGTQAIILGSGYGYGWLSGVVGVWEVSPHNGFIQVAVRLGLLGAALVFFPYAAAIWRLGPTRDPTSRIIWLWTIGVLIYYIPYAGTMLTGILLGTGIVLLLTRTEAFDGVDAHVTPPTRPSRSR